jgi:hypothetical protein
MEIAFFTRTATFIEDSAEGRLQPMTGRPAT